MRRHFDESFVRDFGHHSGPFQVDVELWYQPIGYRWAHNLAAYDSMETHRFVKYYEANPSDTAIIVARASANH